MVSKPVIKFSPLASRYLRFQPAENGTVTVPWTGEHARGTTQALHEGEEEEEEEQEDEEHEERVVSCDSACMFLMFQYFPGKMVYKYIVWEERKCMMS